MRSSHAVLLVELSTEQSLRAYSDLLILVSESQFTSSQNHITGDELEVDHCIDKLSVESSSQSIMLRAVYRLELMSR